eukprot:1062533-Amphidinium_carterae.2
MECMKRGSSFGDLRICQDHSEYGNAYLQSRMNAIATCSQAEGGSLNDPRYHALTYYLLKTVAFPQRQSNRISHSLVHPLGLFFCTCAATIAALRHWFHVYPLGALADAREK